MLVSSYLRTYINTMFSLFFSFLLHLLQFCLDRLNQCSLRLSRDTENGEKDFHLPGHGVWRTERVTSSCFGGFWRWRRWRRWDVSLIMSLSLCWNCVCRYINYDFPSSFFPSSLHVLGGWTLVGILEKKSGWNLRMVSGVCAMKVMMVRSIAIECRYYNAGSWSGYRVSKLVLGVCI